MINANPDLPVRVEIPERAALAIITALPQGPCVAHPPAFENTLAEARGVSIAAIERGLRMPGCVGLAKLLEREAFLAVLTAKVRGTPLTIAWSDDEFAWILSTPPAPALHFSRAA